MAGNLSRFHQNKNLKEMLCPGRVLEKGNGKMMVQLLLEGMKLARYRDVVDQQLTKEDDMIVGFKRFAFS